MHTNVVPTNFARHSSLFSPPTKQKKYCNSRINFDNYLQEKIFNLAKNTIFLFKRFHIFSCLFNFFIAQIKSVGFVRNFGRSSNNERDSQPDAELWDLFLFLFLVFGFFVPEVY